MRPLTEIEPCFQGVVPSFVATASADGEPHLINVSIVHLLSSTTIGVSCQFMKRTLDNLRNTKRALVLVIDPATYVDYLIEARFARLLDSGPVFERMGATLEGVASQSGMTDTFALAGVAELEVVDWQPRTAKPVRAAMPAATESSLVRVERILEAMSAATDLEGLLEDTFASLNRELDLEHGFLLMADGAEERLYTLASRGFEQACFGAEIAIGEGIYGTVAARRKPIRTGSLVRERLMSGAVARETAQPDPTYLPLPGLANVESTIAVPLLDGNRCRGVLSFQSSTAGAFTTTLETTLLIVARHLAALLQRHESEAKPSQIASTSGERVPDRVAYIKYFESDASVFIDNDYLIKGVPGRILWRVLSNYASDQRDAFSSKEIRLDAEIGLPALKDNLETRLIALRKRLEERTTVIRIEKTGRGLFRLLVSHELVLERRA